ncbi:MAG: hypothetical protein ACKONH_07475, partial [Planctomycetia bacterium]
GISAIILEAHPQGVQGFPGHWLGVHDQLAKIGALAATGLQDFDRRPTPVAAFHEKDGLQFGFDAGRMPCPH